MRKFAKNVFCVYGPAKSLKKTHDALHAGLEKLVEEKKIEKWGYFNPEDDKLALPIEDDEEEEEEEDKFADTVESSQEKQETEEKKE